MLRILVLCAGLALAAVPLRAEEAPGADIQAVIREQVDAFRADDFDAAFGYASPAIRGVFGSSRNFAAMVRGGYPMVYRAGEVTFLELRPAAEGWAQRVLVRDAAGRLHLLEYEMVEGQDGWKINGVRLLTAASVGA